MAEKTKDALKEQSSTTFYDNDLGGITPADHRQFNEDLIDSMATAAQGSKADSAIQAFRVMTPDGWYTIRGGTSTYNLPHMVQAVTVGGEPVELDTVTLHLPAIPDVKTHVSPTKYTSDKGVLLSGDIQLGIIGNIAYLVGNISSASSTVTKKITLSGFPADYLSRISTNVLVMAYMSDDNYASVYITPLYLSASGTSLVLQFVNPNEGIALNKFMDMNSIIRLRNV